MDFAFDHNDVIKLAKQNNDLLKAFIAHPDFNKDNPNLSPKPLWFAADFVRRTYIEYIMPLLPKDAQYKSPTIANRGIFPYQHVDPSLPPFPEPIKGEDTWLNDLENWPSQKERKSKKYKETFNDAFTRTMTIAMTINDSTGRSAAMLGGPFDWDKVPEIKQITTDIMPA